MCSNKKQKIHNSIKSFNIGDLVYYLSSGNVKQKRIIIANIAYFKQTQSVLKNEKVKCETCLNNIVTVTSTEINSYFGWVPAECLFIEKKSSETQTYVDYLKSNGINFENDIHINFYGCLNHMINGTKQK